MTLIATLTKQESVVLALVAKGWRNARIAAELTISVRTVESHLTSIFGKLNVNSRTEAALYALHIEQAKSLNLRVSHDDTPMSSPYASR